MLLYYLSTSPEEVSKDSEVFLHQDPSSTEDCEPVEFPVEECPSSVAPSISGASECSGKWYDSLRCMRANKGAG